MTMHIDVRLHHPYFVTLSGHGLQYHYQSNM
jgi:hypothetical protein